MTEGTAAPDPRENKRLVLLKDGKIYFCRQTERRFYFALTVMMLILGLCFELGIF